MTANETGLTEVGLNLQFEAANSDLVEPMVKSGRVLNDEVLDGGLRSMVVLLPDGSEEDLRHTGIFKSIERVPNDVLGLFV